MKKMNTPLAVPSHRILNRALRGQDIVHVQFPFFLGLKAIRVARRLKIPVVTTFHIQAEHLAMNAGIHSKKFIRYCYKFWMKHYFNKSDLVICPSIFAETELKFYELKAPSTVISNGVIPLFKPAPVKKPLNLSGKFIILSVGRFAPEKHQGKIITAINASAHSENIQLILLGEGPLKERLIETGKILPNPPLLYSLPQDKMAEYYNFSDLYVHPATVEVECMAVLEAMACGLPVLIGRSPKSATSQFALDDRSLFDADDALDLRNKIDYWIEHPKELTSAKEKYSAYSRMFRIEASFEKLVSCYHNLVGKANLVKQIRNG